VTDACGCGHAEAAERALASLRYAGDALFTDVAEICDVLNKRRWRDGQIPDRRSMRHEPSGQHTNQKQGLIVELSAVFAHFRHQLIFDRL
jgi:hypothetical protein